MDLKFKKQLWLETVLKTLYRKVHFLQTGERKIEFPQRKADSNTEKETQYPKRKADSDTENFPSSKRQKKCPKKNCEPLSEDSVKENSEAFWDFVDDFILSRSFPARTDKEFFDSIPSTVDYSVWTNIDFMRHQLSSMDEEKDLATKIYFKIQKARMRKSAEEISKEFLKEENSA